MLSWEGLVQGFLNDEARFIVHSDGHREIINIAVVPVDDNFDFDSSTTPAKITNWLTKERIDPSGIGRTVPIVFTETITNKQTLTSADWSAMDTANRHDEALRNLLGTRSVLEYLLSPVQKAWHEAGRER